MVNLKNFEKLSDGVKAALKISISRELMMFSGENGIISERLHKKLIQLQIVNTSDTITFDKLKVIFG